MTKRTGILWVMVSVLEDALLLDFLIDHGKSVNYAASPSQCSAEIRELKCSVVVYPTLSRLPSAASTVTLSTLGFLLLLS